MTPSAFSGLLQLLLLASLFPASPGAAGGDSLAGLSEIGGAPRPFVRFAAVGAVDAQAKAGKLVCDRVRSWTPEFVIALGNGGFPGSAAEVLGFPWQEGRWERRRGPVHVFALDAGAAGAGRDGGAEWLRKALQASTAPWKIVCLSRAPYSSYRGLPGPGGASAAAAAASAAEAAASAAPASPADPGRAVRWPFRQWGADAVIAGRDGNYERLEVDGIPYFVNGLEGKGGAASRLPGSQCLFDEDLGAMLIEADAGRMDFRFVTSDGLVVDARTLRHGVVAAGPLGAGRGSAAVRASLRR